MRPDIHDGREQKLQSEAGYIDARPLTDSDENLLQRAAGPYIGVGGPSLPGLHSLASARRALPSIGRPSATPCGRSRSAPPDRGQIAVFEAKVIERREAALALVGDGGGGDDPKLTAIEARDARRAGSRCEANPCGKFPQGFAGAGKPATTLLSSAASPAALPGKCDPWVAFVILLSDVSPADATKEFWATEFLFTPPSGPGAPNAAPGATCSAAPLHALHRANPIRKRSIQVEIGLLFLQLYRGAERR
jgi:hypothetical protein